MSKTVSILLAILALFLIVGLGFVAFLVVRDIINENPQDEVASGPTEVVATALPPTATVLPPPVFEILPTITPIPTDTPLPPTPTAASTETPQPTATNTPAPVIIFPTNTPVPPTNTPAPSQPQSARGLVATHFGLQDRSVYQVNKQIWFEFTIVNNSGGDVPYSRLGVLPRKNGADRYDWFQQSYGGPNAAMRPDGLSHEDNIKLPESGSYTLRLAICFDGYDACLSGGGSWVTMSQEIPVTIN